MSDEIKNALVLDADDMRVLRFTADLMSRELGESNGLADDAKRLAGKLEAAGLSAGGRIATPPASTWRVRVAVSGYIDRPDVEAPTASAAADKARDTLWGDQSEGDGIGPGKHGEILCATCADVVRGLVPVRVLVCHGDPPDAWHEEEV
jgi:hypothetical protein